MNIYLIIAAFLSLFNTNLHFFLGGRDIARPLLEAQTLTDEVRYVQYYCWHIATISLLLQTFLFAIAAVKEEQTGLAITATAFAASFAILGVLMPVFFKISYKIVPQGWLFVPVTVFGLLGILL